MTGREVVRMKEEITGSGKKPGPRVDDVWRTGGSTLRVLHVGRRRAFVRVMDGTYRDSENSCKAFFHGIGYVELRMHKRWLAGLAWRMRERKEAEHAEGLLSMIDALQDTAERMFGEDRAFGKDKENDR